MQMDLNRSTAEDILFFLEFKDISIKIKVYFDPNAV